MKRWTALLLALIMVLAMFSVAHADNNYYDCLRNLNTFLLNSELADIDIAALAEDFRLLGNQGYSVQFRMYCMMLEALSLDDIDTAEMYLMALNYVGDFGTYLGSEKFEQELIEHCDIVEIQPAIRPLSEVEHYIAGRRAELQGDRSGAYNEYVQCVNFYDAADRMMNNLVGNSSVQSADEMFKSALDAYTQGDLIGAVSILSTIKDKHPGAAAMYEVIKVELTKSAVTPTPVPTVAPTSAPTAVVTKQPSGNNTASNKGHWSDWSTDKPSDGVKIDTKTQYRQRSVETEYRYRTLTQKTTRNQELTDASLVTAYNETGAWGDWTDNPISSSPTLEVETRQQDILKTVTLYSYSRYYFINTDHNSHTAPYDYSKEKIYLRSGQWQYDGPSETRRPYVKDIKCHNGKAYPWYEGNWWNEVITTEDRVVGTKTQYRSRSVDIVRIYNVWSSWSGWSKTKVTASSTCEVDTRTNYGNWSSWSDNSVSSSSGTQVETRTLYRYWIAE